VEEIKSPKLAVAGLWPVSTAADINFNIDQGKSLLPFHSHHVRHVTYLILYYVIYYKATLKKTI
jgi:hypothetical protein